jgi:glutamate---cysteine ligase / carboxylate-amine ligase
MVDPPRSHAESAQRIAFPGCTAPTVGVELEVSLIDPETRGLAPRATEVLDRFDGDASFKPELFQTIIELNTGVCHDVPGVRADLQDRLDRLRAVCDEMGLAFMGSGTHPAALWSELPITQEERYLRLVENCQWTARRLLICGVHVHVGVKSGEHAIALTNALACFIPHFLALSASSPYWMGLDTGLASSRIKVFESLPTAGLPPPITNWTEFVTFMRTLLQAGTIDSIREVWWDIRPHPGFGTIELRMCDGMNTLTEICAVAAFAQCLIVYLSDMYDQGGTLPVLRNWTLKENKWRACRSAEKANFVRNERGEQIPIAEHILEWVDHLGPTARALGCEEDLHYVRRILEHGPSYQRQRAVYAERGSLEAVVDAMVEELKEDQPWRR